MNGAEFVSCLVLLAFVIRIGFAIAEWSCDGKATLAAAQRARDEAARETERDIRSAELAEISARVKASGEWPTLPKFAFTPVEPEREGAKEFPS